MTMEPNNNEDDDIIFPLRPKRVKTYQAETINSDSEDEKEGGEEEHSYSPPWFLPEPGSWAYNPMKGLLLHKFQYKQILLSKLNSSQKVIKLISVLENDKELDVDSLIISLEEAALDCFDKNLSEVLSEFSDGRGIEWKSRQKMKKEQALKEKRGFLSN